jgi:PAS domain S-box-containing protein
MTVRHARHNRKGHLSKLSEKVDNQKEKFIRHEFNYQALIEQIPAVTYITALEGSKSRLYVSPQIETMLGFPAADWLSESDLWVQRLHPDDRQRVLNTIYDSYKNQKPFCLEYRLIARDGHVVWVQDKAIVVCDESGKPCFIQGVMVDVSDPLQAVETLRKNEKRFRTIFERTAVGIALVDMEGRLIECNPALQEMFGYRKEELLTKDFSEFIHADDQSIDLDLYKKLLSKMHDHYQVEKRYLRKDEGVVWGRVNVSLVRDAEGNPQYTIHMVENINEWKRLETQLLQSQKMETVGRLAGGIAHDFNNLLTVIKGYTQLSLIEIGEDHPLRKDIEEIKNAAERAKNLTHQLLAFSRRQIMDMKVLDLNAVIRNLEKMMRRVIGEDIEMSIILAEDLGRVKTDPHQIEQVILNLAVNARDAMPEGGRLTLETSDVELDEGGPRAHILMIPGRYVMLSISDTGSGMTPEVKERIFEPFFTTKGEGKGTGLGLSTVYGIIKQSGGYIWVYSEQGQGTTFKIYLPRVDEEVDELPQKNRTGPLPKGNETVLLVEDDPSVRELAARVLREQGYSVLEAANGEEAMQITQAPILKEIHLLLTDMVMPQMGGKELGKRLKALYPEVKVLFVSGYTDNAFTHQEFIGPGMNLLQKPFSLGTLARRVREILDK